MMLYDSVGPDAARAAVRPRVQRSRRLEMSSLHAHELAQRCTSGWTDRIGFAVPGKPPSVRYGQDEFMSSLYTLDAPLTSLRTRVRARRASGASARKTRVTHIRGLTKSSKAYWSSWHARAVRRRLATGLATARPTAPVDLALLHLSEIILSPHPHGHRSAMV